MKFNKKPVALLLIIILFLPIISLEWYVRKKVTKCVIQIVNQNFNSSIKVMLQSKILLFDILRKNITGIQILPHSNSDKEISLSATIKNIKLRNFNSGAYINNLTAELTWPMTEIANILNQKLPNLNNTPLIAGVNLDPNSNGIKIEFIGGLAYLIIKPQIEIKKINFQVLTASAFGFELPKDKVQQIISVLTNEIGTLPNNIKIDKITVNNFGLHMHITGKKIILTEDSNQSKSLQNCS